MGATGTALVDFGSIPAAEASVAVTGQATITATSKVEAFLMADDSTGTNTATDHAFGAIGLRLSCGSRVAGVGFTIFATTMAGFATGQFQINWVWV